MTFALGIRLQHALIGIADTRITSGTEVTTARKFAIDQRDGQNIFFLTSGLRSVRDKALTYFNEDLENRAAPYDHLYQVVNAFASQIRRVAAEDEEALTRVGLPFDIHVLVGGQCRADTEPALYLLYPQGSWVEIGAGTPYQIVGVGSYGKPVLDRALTYEDSIEHALTVGLLAFDATRISASNVDFPIDVLIFTTNPRRIVSHRYEEAELRDISKWWQDRIRASVQEVSKDWQGPLWEKVGNGAQTS